MKKFLTRGLVLSLLFFVLTSLVLTGCTPTTPTIIENVDRIVFEVSADTINVFYSNPSLEKETIYNGQYSEGNLAEIIDRLDNGSILNAKSTTSTYGTFYIEVGNLKPTGSGYLCFCTSLIDYQEADSEWSTSLSYNDIVLKGASVGASSLPLEDGAIFIILVKSGI